MKIAMLSPFARKTPAPGGEPERIVSLLAEGLIARGHEVRILETGDPSSAERPPDEKASARLPVVALMEQMEPFDLIHNFAGCLPLTYSGWVLPSMMTTLYDLPSSNRLAVFKHYNRSSFYVAACHAARHPDLEYIATVYHGPDAQRYDFCNRPGSYFFVLDPIRPGDGLPEAVHTAKSLGMDLVLGGRILDRSYFDEKIVPEMNGSRIRYEEGLGDAERLELLGGASALLRFTEFPEPFSFTLMEAMACGTPVIARRRGAAPEIVEDGRTGFIVDDADSAIQAGKKIFRIDRSECRRAVEERFCQGKMVEDYLRIYERISEGSMGQARKGRRPWGIFTVLEDGKIHKVKRIEVFPGKRLSYQRHERRAEHWMIVQGEAVVTLNGQEKRLASGHSIDIPQKAAHRIANPGSDSLIFIEVQRGEYLGEDDIIRIEDDFGRTREP